MKKTAVLLTVYNRKEVTLQGLRSLYQAIEVLNSSYIFEIYMTDDGCTDGTAEVVHKEFPDIHIVQGNGSLFWNRGMLLAWKEARKNNFDFYLWWNDDTILFEDSLKVLFGTYKKVPLNSIVVGCISSAVNLQEVTYSGINDDQNLVSPNGEVQTVKFMNGNLVLIPNCVVNTIGLLNPIFHHGGGDYEYAIRARKQGIGVYITPIFVGTCERHDVVRKCFRSDIPFLQRVKYLYSPQGFKPKQTFYYMKLTKGAMYAARFVIWTHFRTLFPDN